MAWRPSKNVAIIVMPAALLAGAGCAAPSSRGERQIHYGERGSQTTGKVTQTELQQDLQRFSTVFMDRVAQAAEDVRASSKSPAIRQEAIRRTLLYTTNALDIASEPYPDVALLDMVVFITLTKDALREHWIPELFKEEGKPFEVAFDRSEPEIWKIADKVSTPAQQEKLKELIARWKQENGGQTRVEGVRFSNFSEKAGKVATERASDSGGLLSSVASGVEAADDALLMADRVLFLAQRYPFLLRLQAALGAGDVVGEIAAKFEPGGTLDSVMKDGMSITQSAGIAAREGRMLAEALYPLVLPKKYKLGSYLQSGNDLAAKALQLVQELNSASPGALRNLDGFTNRIFVSLFLLGAGLAGVWWGGYYVVKKRLAPARPADAERPRDRGKAA